MGLFRRKENRDFFPVELSFPSGSINFAGEENSVVSRCVNKIVNTLSVLPLNLYSYTKNGKVQIFNHSVSYLLQKPAHEETPVLFYSTLIRHLLLEGNVYLHIGRDRNGAPVNLTICKPSSVIVERDRNYRKVFIIAGKTYTEREVLHIPFVSEGYNGTKGVSPVETHRELVNLYNNLQLYIQNYFNNSIGTRYSLELDSNTYSSKSTEIAKVYAAIVPVLNKYVTGAGNAGKIMIPPPGAKLSKIDQISNVQAELSSLLIMLEQQICGIFNVPYELVSTENKYGSLEERQRDFLQNCIAPLGKHIAQSFQTLIPTADYNLFVSYDYKPMLETDTKTTIDYLRSEVQSGLLTINEARRMLDMAPIEEDLGNLYWMPANLIPLTKENVAAYFGSAKSKLGIQGLGSDKQ